MTDLSSTGETAQSPQSDARPGHRPRWRERWDLIAIALFVGIQSVSLLHGGQNLALTIAAFAALILVCVANGVRRAQALRSPRAPTNVRREVVGGVIIVVAVAAVVSLGWQLAVVDGIDAASWAAGVVVFLVVAVGGIIGATPPEPRPRHRVS